jgi:polar amino acid transport system permease protein
MNYALLKLAIKAVILGLLGLLAILFVYWFFVHAQWGWLPKYIPLLLKGLWLTIVILVSSCVFGMLLAVPIGLVQVTGPPFLAKLAGGFCTVIRGTPLLVQLWLLYYGVGTSLFPNMPWLRDTFLWPVLSNGIFYVILAFTLSVAGYEGEVMRGAFLGVPRGELEAGRACGMSPFQVLRRVWLPRAVRMVLPTLAGETVLQLQSTPLAFTVAVMDLMGVITKVRQDTFITFEPLLFLAGIYVVLTFLITRSFNWYERRIPQKR